MDREPLITTIIPTFRRPQMLRRAIRSVLQQTYSRYQIHVYDNASGDETADVVAELARSNPQIIYYRHSYNIGIVKNFIGGMKNVKTPFFSILSDDDVLLPNFYETAMEGFNAHPQAIFSAVGSILVDAQGQLGDIPNAHWRSGYYEPPGGLLEILQKGHPASTGVLWRKRFTEVVDLQELEDDNYLCDRIFVIKASTNSPFVISANPGVLLNNHPLTYRMLTQRTINWLGPNLRVAREINEEDSLPLPIRAHAVQLLTNWIKHNLLSVGLTAIINQDDETTQRVYDAYDKYYHKDLRIIILYYLFNIGKHLPSARNLVELFLGLRTGINRYRKKAIFHAFGNFKKYLRLLP